MTTVMVHGFAPALTSFVGRAAAVAEVAGLLGESRLVTVTGPGGVGKTRLAGEVAQQVAARFADGVWLVELAEVQDPGQVPAAAAAAVGAREQPGVAVTDALAGMLARQQVLLVLDNCEQVAGAAAAMAATLLAAADDLRILATSREPLDVAGEARYRLPPLALPARDDPDGVARSDAVALFADRARRVDPRFTLGGGASLVARLVAKLDGMPLAIELAAARVEALGLAQLLDRLDDRFALLARAEWAPVPARHRSLTATADWSYRLLGEPEQRVFRQVSVFPGPFTLDAAEAIAGSGAGAAVLRLVDCSLVSPPRAGPDGRSRYPMLQTLRGYGRDRLAEAGELEEATAALAQYAVTVAERAAAAMQTGGGELAAGRWLDAEDALTSRALGWALEHNPGMALRLAVALAPWWRARGRSVAADSLLHAAAGHAPLGSPGWSAARYWLGQTAMNGGDITAALGHFTALRDAIAAAGPSRALADCLGGRSVALANLGRLREAAADAQRALALARSLRYPAGEALALTNCAIAAYYAGDIGRAVRWAQQAQRACTADVPGWTCRVCSNVLVLVLLAAGELAAAARCCEDALASCREAGDLQVEAALLVLLVRLDLDAGRLPGAAGRLREALQVASRIGQWDELMNCLDHCGHLCAATGRWADAVTLWAAYATQVEKAGLSEPQQEALRRREPLREATRALGPGGTRDAGRRGAAMTLATAGEFATMIAAGPLETQQPPGPWQLSRRERELVTLVAQGHTDAQIAGHLTISIRTVRSHLDRIRDKTGCRRRADLTRLALQAGLV